MSGATTAVAIGAGVAGAATLAGSAIQSSAAKSAAKTQANAENNATAAQQQMFQQSQENLAPFISQGNEAAQKVSQLEGLGSGGPGEIMSTLQGLPGYQFANYQGLKSTENSASARGLGISGAAQKGAAAYSTGLANQYYNNLLSGVQATETTGANAAGGLATTSANVGSNIAQTTVGAGQAQAAGTLGSANAIAGGLGSVGSLVYANSILSGLNNPNGGLGFEGSGVPTAGSMAGVPAQTNLFNGTTANTLTGVG